MHRVGVCDAWPIPRASVEPNVHTETRCGRGAAADHAADTRARDPVLVEQGCELGRELPTEVADQVTVYECGDGVSVVLVARLAGEINTHGMQVPLVPWHAGHAAQLTDRGLPLGLAADEVAWWIPRSPDAAFDPVRDDVRGSKARFAGEYAHEPDCARTQRSSQASGLVRVFLHSLTTDCHRPAIGGAVGWLPGCS